MSCKLGNYVYDLPLLFIVTSRTLTIGDSALIFSGYYSNNLLDN